MWSGRTGNIKKNNRTFFEVYCRFLSFSTHIGYFWLDTQIVAFLELFDYWNQQFLIISESINGHCSQCKCTQIKWWMFAQEGLRTIKIPPTTKPDYTESHETIPMGISENAHFMKNRNFHVKSSKINTFNLEKRFKYIGISKHKTARMSFECNIFLM